MSTPLLKLFRMDKRANSLIGSLYLDKEFLCYTLEDLLGVTPDRPKVFGETHIPTGEYFIKLRNYGGFYERYKKLGDWHQEMLQLHDVPGFSDILIHRGNSAENSHGCILLGSAVSIKGELLDSAGAYEEVYKRLLPYAKLGNLKILIKDISSSPVVKAVDSL